MTCYAAWNTDHSQRQKSASGGISTALGKYFLAKTEGVVFGVTFDAELNPVFKAALTEEDLETFKGSKYVQAKFNADTVRQVEAYLQDGKCVLFIGLPCQIAALKLAVSDRTNLILADLLCHGVAPAKYLQEEISFLKEHNKLGKITDIRFRSNDRLDFHLSLWNGTTLLYDKPADRQPYFSAYLWGIGLREACYSCKYACPEREGDITLGDFIGLNVKNASIVTANTGKGEQLLQDMFAAMPEIHNEEQSLSLRLNYRPSIMEPVKRHPSDKRFRSLYPSIGYARAIRKTLAVIYFKRRILMEYVAIKRKLGIKGALFGRSSS